MRANRGEMHGENCKQRDHTEALPLPLADPLLVAIPLLVAKVSNSKMKTHLLSLNPNFHNKNPSLYNCTNKLLYL